MKQFIIKSNQKSLGSNCIFDPIHKIIKPINLFLTKNNFILRIITAIDGLLIEFSFFSLGILWVKNYISSSLYPSILFFYIFRAFCLSASKWPQPENYIFSNPGVPYYFISYKNTNDLYFSGHTGGITVLLMDVIYYKRSKFIMLLMPLLFYTMFILLVENMHYTNDVIIGFLAGFSVSRIVFYYRKNYSLIVLKVYIKIAMFIKYLINLKMKEIFENFGPKKKDNTSPKLSKQSSQDFELNKIN